MRAYSDGSHCQDLRDHLVHHRVDTAHEETGYTADLRRVTAILDEHGEALEVCPRHLVVAINTEQQRDVDIDAFADQLSNRRTGSGVGSVCVRTIRQQQPLVLQPSPKPEARSSSQAPHGHNHDTGREVSNGF